MSERDGRRGLVVASARLAGALAAFVAFVVLVGMDALPEGTSTTTAGLLAGCLIVLAVRGVARSTKTGVVDCLVVVDGLTAAPEIEQIRALRIMGMTFSDAKVATASGLDVHVSCPLSRREAHALATTLRRHGVTADVTPTDP